MGRNVTADRAAGEEPRGPGRPLDPAVRERILAATLDVYAMHGWAGLTFKQISTEAGVSRGSIYARWDSKHDLLKEALLDVTSLDSVVSDDVRERLVDYLYVRTENLIGPSGDAVLRYQVDARVMPEEFEDIVQAVTRDRMAAARQWLEAEVHAGRVRRTPSEDAGNAVDDASSRTAVEILENLEGAAIMYALRPRETGRGSAAGRTGTSRTTLRAWAEDVVDRQLAR